MRIPSISVADSSKRWITDDHTFSWNYNLTDDVIAIYEVTNWKKKISFFEIIDQIIGHLNYITDNNKNQLNDWLDNWQWIKVLA